MSTQDTLRELRACAASWEPDARLVGNVRAADIVRALDDVLHDPRLRLDVADVRLLCHYAMWGCTDEPPGIIAKRVVDALGGDWESIANVHGAHAMVGAQPEREGERRAREIDAMLRTDGFEPVPASAYTVGDAIGLRREPAPEAAKPALPVCSTCNDTHRMPLGEGHVMCTRCPLPCQSCRAGGNGPYCERTPCSCKCHAVHALDTGRE